MFFLYSLGDWDSAKEKKQSNSIEILQEYFAILAAGEIGVKKQELLERKLVNAKNRDGQWKVTAEVFETFRIAEQIFKRPTETCSREINGKHITEAVLANFSKFKVQSCKLKKHW